MKKIFTLLCVALAAVSCIDDDYDLGKVETGNITIGGDQTAFEMPLAQIVIGMTELRNGSSDVKAIFEEADIWLPSTLPGGTAYAAHPARFAFRQVGPLERLADRLLNGLQLLALGLQLGNDVLKPDVLLGDRKSVV